MIENWILVLILKIVSSSFNTQATVCSAAGGWWWGGEFFYIFILNLDFLFYFFLIEWGVVSLFFISLKFWFFNFLKFNCGTESFFYIFTILNFEFWILYFKLIVRWWFFSFLIFNFLNFNCGVESVPSIFGHFWKSKLEMIITFVEF